MAAEGYLEEAEAIRPEKSRRIPRTSYVRRWYANAVCYTEGGISPAQGLDC